MLAPKHRLAGWATVGFLAFDFISIAFLELASFDSVFVTAIVTGVYVGQINLTATWGALGPGNIVVRLPWSILLGILMWYAFAVGSRAVNSRAVTDPDFIVLGPIILGGIIVVQIPLWIAVKSFRWRLIDLEDEARESGDGPLQFSIRHLFLVTVFVALASGLGRVVLPPFEADMLRLDGEVVAVLAALVATNLVITVPCIWGALVKSNPIPPVVWPAYCFAATLIEFSALCVVLGSPGGEAGEVLAAFLILNLLQCATVYLVLRAFRRVGFRLVRTSPR